MEDKHFASRMLICAGTLMTVPAMLYVLVHHTRGQYESVAAEMDGLLGISHTYSVSVRCRMGAFEICKEGR